MGFFAPQGLANAMRVATIKPFLSRGSLMFSFKHTMTISLGLLSAMAFAQTTKPGLWEISSKMDTSGNSEMAKQMAEAQKQMAAMPPAQRKMMEDMMAKQGMSMNMKGDGSTVIKVCITPEMANRPPVEQQKDCAYNFPARSGNTQRFSFQCTQPVSSGEGEITFKGTDDYDGKMKLTTTHQGKKETVNMNTSGRFLSSNCGTIKPMVPSKG
jgi:Protein of unknown function (DUF3617)